MLVSIYHPTVSENICVCCVRKVGYWKLGLKHYPRA
jgi:hypothetical protein